MNADVYIIRITSCARYPVTRMNAGICVMVPGMNADVYIMVPNMNANIHVNANIQV